MEKIICSSCGATITPNTTQPFLTCEYCDTAIPNAYYVESDAKAAATSTLDELCVQKLIEMGESENLSELEGERFGNPIRGAHTERDIVDVPADEQMYLCYSHTALLGGVKEAFVLADGGAYYLHDGDKGHRSWEAFITGAIACEDRGGWTEEGQLSIGSSLQFAVSSEADSRMARFLVDFHNLVYRQHTGETAPAAWKVTAYGEQAVEVEREKNVSVPSVAATVLTAAGALLGGTLRKRTTTAAAPHRPVLNTARRTTIPKVRFHDAEPPRPARGMHAHPAQRQPMARPDRPNRPAGGRGGMGGPGNMGGRGGMRGPGNMGGRKGPGGPGKGRR